MSSLPPEDMTTINQMNGKGCIIVKARPSYRKEERYMVWPPSYWLCTNYLRYTGRNENKPTEWRSEPNCYVNGHEIPDGSQILYPDGTTEYIRTMSVSLMLEIQEEGEAIATQVRDERIKDIVVNRKPDATKQANRAIDKIAAALVEDISYIDQRYIELSQMARLKFVEAGSEPTSGAWVSMNEVWEDLAEIEERVITGFEKFRAKYADWLLKQSFRRQK